MTGMRQGRRAVLLVLAYSALFALSALIAEVSDTAGVVVLGVATVVFVAIVYRWWALLLPTAGTAVWLGVLRINDWITGACSVCGSDEDWSNAWMLWLAFIVLPLTAAASVGLLAGWLARPGSGPPRSSSAG
jgi:hypothetical protein